MNATEAKPARRTRRQWRELEAELAAVRAKIEAAESDVTGLTDRLDVEGRAIAKALDNHAAVADELRTLKSRPLPRYGAFLLGMLVGVVVNIAVWSQVSR